MFSSPLVCWSVREQCSSESYGWIFSKFKEDCIGRLRSTEESIKFPEATVRAMGIPVKSIDVKSESEVGKASYGAMREDL